MLDIGRQFLLPGLVEGQRFSAHLLGQALVDLQLDIDRLVRIRIPFRVSLRPRPSCFHAASSWHEAQDLPAVPIDRVPQHFAILDRDHAGIFERITR
jgi:hypothetical protein